MDQQMSKRQSVTPAIRSWDKANELTSKDIPPLRQSSSNLSPEDARSKDKDHSDGVSLDTRVDRGYLAAEEAFSTATKPNDTHSDFSLTSMGTHLDNPQQSAITSMADAVATSLVKYAGDSNRGDFLPTGRLFEIFNEAAVYSALSEALSDPLDALSDPLDALQLQDDVAGYAGKICGSIVYCNRNGKSVKGTASRMMFAILVVLEQVKEIIPFIDSGFTDECLPLVLSGVATNYCLFPKGLSSDQWHCWTVGKSWPRVHWMAFHDYQYKMVSPFFDLDLDNETRKLPHYDLEPKTILPFIEDCGIDEVFRGGFSFVRKVKIHPGNYSLKEDMAFAVKELVLDPDRHELHELTFKQEIKAWAKSVGVKNHPHLINILATWQQNGRWNMLFPWANSNLKDYWKTNQPRHEHSYVKWIARQCLGLARGLQKVHRSSSDQTVTDWGIHGDIKPENILLFDDATDKYGKLVITDFGLTRFHGPATRSHASPEGMSPSYRPPEYDLQQRISRAYDMWTLGCLYLEFITWYLMGPEGLDPQFIEQRQKGDRGEPSGFLSDKFFNFTLKEDGPKVELKESVKEWIEYLRSHPLCSPFIHDFLDLVTSYLLQVVHSNRERCDRTVRRLVELHDRCVRDGERYSLAPPLQPRLAMADIDDDMLPQPNDDDDIMSLSSASSSQSHLASQPLTDLQLWTSQEPETPPIDKFDMDPLAMAIDQDSSSTGLVF